MLKWMQEYGFGFDVCTDLDWHNGIDNVDDYESVILNTHPDYWTMQMYRNLADFLDNGGNLIYLGGNAIARSEPSPRKPMKRSGILRWPIIPKLAYSAPRRIWCSLAAEMETSSRSMRAMERV